MTNNDQNTSELPSLRDVLKKWYTPGTVTKFKAKEIEFEGNTQAVKSLSVSIVSRQSKAERAFRQVNEEVHKE